VIDVRFRHFVDPKLHKSRKRAQFRATLEKTFDALEYELNRLQAKEILIEAGFKNSDIRNNGWPRGGAKPEHPAIVLHFTSKGKALSFPSDAHETYHQNLHAVALTLEALRAVDRHGVSKGEEQYTGFAQLAAPGESESLAWAAKTVAELSQHYSTAERIIAKDGDYIGAFRAAVRIVHPDVGGKREDFDKLIQAASLLDAHFKEKPTS